MRIKPTILLGAALSLLMTLTTAHAAGKGNGGGGSGGGGNGGGGEAIGGTIYYYGNFPGWGGGTPTISMNPDGSNKTVLGSDGWSTIFGEPSIHLHNNHRWFPKAFSLPDPDHIPTEEEPYKYLEYPDGSWRYELFALRGDYNPYSNNTPQTGALLLADDRTFQLLGGQHWLLNDEYISFVARRWSSAEEDATVVEGGIYVLPLVYDADGNITGLGEAPTTPTIPLPLVPYDDPYPGVEDHPRPDVNYYSWAPTSTMFVYTKLSDGYGVWVADVDGTERKITSDPGEMPQWSPDGARIAYGLSGGLVTIKADGKRRSWIVSPESDWLFRWPHWSPDSGHLVFTGLPKVGDGLYSGTGDLFLVSANGRDMVNLTNTPDDRELTSAFNAGWR